MNGKELKVAEYNLTFGSSQRRVNVFGLLKYKPNNNIYVIYADLDNTYNIVYYGSSHIKNNSILSMSSNKSNDEEIIKEYIYEIVENKELNNFEILSLKDIEEIEIISSNRLELKKEILDKLVKLTIPKRDKSNEVVAAPKKKKKSLLNTLFVLIIIGGGCYGGYYYYINFLNSNDNNAIDKTITCSKTYSHEDLANVNVSEEQVFNFNTKDVLKRVDVTTVYNFTNEDDYFNFINMGLYYKYMPDDALVDGGWDNDDVNHSFKMIAKENIGNNYDKPTNYEEVLTYYKSEDYTCVEDSMNNDGTNDTTTTNHGEDSVDNGENIEQ